MRQLFWKPRWLVVTIAGNGARSLNAMANPVATVRGHRHILPEFSPWIAVIIAKVCIVITVLLVAATGVITWCGPVLGAELKPDSQVLTSLKSLTFDDSVRIAINQSPAFTKSSVEIDIRRMDETDSRYGMVPPLTFRTLYYVNRPENTGSRPYSLSFSMDPYNPFGTYYSLQAQKLATQMAILGHLQGISKGIENLGRYYLNLDNFKRQKVYQKALISLNREILTFAENRLSIGTGTSLEAKVAQQELLLSQNELEQIDLSEKRTLAGLKLFLGLPPAAEFSPDLRDIRHQVLGNFNPATANLEQAKKSSYDIKVVDIQKKLQGYKILLAKAQVIPNLLFSTQTPDPLNATTGNGLYVAFGLEIPVWDGFKRIRNISRQKAVLKQVDAIKEEKENSLESKWLTETDVIQASSVALKIAQSREELARLKANQNEVRYQSGEVTLPVSLESRKQVIAAQKETLGANMGYDLAVLKLRELSGDLGNTYVDANSWQK
ncbi:MAG: TolC family protein [Desulfobaccales bacterium]